MSKSSTHLNLNLKVWRQSGANESGRFVEYKAEGISTEASFLEMLDIINERLIQQNQEPIAFDHDCREGICGSCGFMINGNAHGPQKNTTVCQLHMRHFKNGETIVLEPFRASSFPLVKDLMVDRTALDRVISSGGYISSNTGGAPDANAILIPKPDAEQAFASATCIGCGACVASCKNSSAALFTSAKVSHLSFLPQGKVEENERVVRMVAQMDAEGFGACSTTGACAAACPVGINLTNIARMNKIFMRSVLKGPQFVGSESEV